MLKNVFILTLSVLLFSGLNANAAETNYQCEGTKEVQENFGAVLVWLTEDTNGEYWLSLDFGDGAAKTNNAKCELDGKMTGLIGVLSLACVDEDGTTLPVVFDLNSLTLKADFQFPGFGSILIETQCSQK